MYIPKLTSVDDFDKQARTIKDHPLGILFSYSAPKIALTDFLLGDKIDKPVDSEMCATHVPFFLQKSQDGSCRLVAHLAGKNQQIKLLKENPSCMVVFQGPNSYVTPAWYPEKEETHKFVPTWDYSCVHVYGKAKIIEEKEWLLKMLNSLTDQEENKRPDGDEFESKWKVEQTNQKYLDSLIKGIVGLEIEVSHIQSKLKVHQNQNPKNVNGVLRGYEMEMGDDTAKQMCKLVRENYPREL
ncbi:Protease synthase and sporulation protein [Lachancea thermotolerans]